MVKSEQCLSNPTWLPDASGGLISAKWDQCINNTAVQGIPDQSHCQLKLSGMGVSELFGDVKTEKIGSFCVTGR